MQSIRTNVTEYEQDGMRLFAARTGVKDIVSLEGSVHGGWYLLPDDLQLAPRLASGLMDADTKQRDKETLRTALAARGANLSFWVSADRTYFSASCLPEDVRFICELVTECLSEAVYRKPELENERARTLGELEESKTQTNDQASHALARLIFDPKHVNYADSHERDVQRVAATSRADLLSFQKLLGKGGLVLAVTGDIAPEKVLKEAARAFAKLPEGTRQLPDMPMNAKKPEPLTKLVTIPDKANIDTFLGVPVALTRDHELYLTFLVLTSMLGSGGLFMGHLMRTIRERDGLTYGIRATASGFAEGADGALRVWATFSPQTFDRAVAMTRKEIGNFFAQGITADALRMEQEHTAGGYAVGLSTSRGLAGMLHKIGREGKPLSYVDDYPNLVRAVTLDSLHAVADLIPLDKLSLAAAGTFVK
jgi:zinc protease